MITKPNLIKDKALKDLLLKQEVITPEKLLEAETYALAEKIKFVSAMIKRNILSRKGLGVALAKHYEVPYSDFDLHLPTRDMVREIPKALGEKLRVVIVHRDDQIITVATDDPVKKGLESALKKALGKEVKEVIITFALSDSIDTAHLGYRPELQILVNKIIKNNHDDAPAIIAAIFDDALIQGVSDIHLEPSEDTVSIRFRIDGLLHEVLRLDSSTYLNVINRVKVKSHLRIDDHFSTQDGAMRYKNEGRKADMRISIIPTTHGEKIVIRVLSKYVRDLALSDLGMGKENAEMLTRAANKPFGMILVVGPTGSGKTTTLYSLISMLNSSEVNITTIEDPVEYKIPGINQIQVNLATELTFARGLRSIVRQDPDIILVGEIRDRETAEIAVNAALTGHLVLTTFHANDAATAIPRLLDMGIEPFLLSSTLELVIAQRLVRRLTKGGKTKKTITKKELEAKIPGSGKFIKDKLIYTEPKESEIEKGTAYRGRTAVYEMISVTGAMEELVIKSPSAREISKQAKKDKMITMFESGIEKVVTGEVSLSELTRVVHPNEESSI